ncbi:ribosome biogenesis protein bop1 [Anolis carolinensis]|uniref:ribosome biogenesis protein bop1 n=1 Tax=Anolis carolinensis TaxID=28377 RepID=UPI002F2B549D
MERGKGEEEEDAGQSSPFLQEQEAESDDLTDSEESVFSGLEDSGSDSPTEEEEEEEEEEDHGSGIEENSDTLSSSEKTKAGEAPKKKGGLGLKVRDRGTGQQEELLENEYVEDSSDEEVEDGPGQDWLDGPSSWHVSPLSPPFVPLRTPQHCWSQLTSNWSAQEPGLPSSQCLCHSF